MTTIKRTLLVLTLLLITNVSNAQAFFNSLELKSGIFPPELAHVEQWLKPAIDDQFYSQSFGFYKNGGNFCLVGRASDLVIPQTNIRFSPIMDKMVRSYKASDEMRIIDKSPIDRYDSNFDYAKLNDPKYIYELLIDVNNLNDKLLLWHCLHRCETKNAVKSFINKLRKVMKIDIHYEDLKPYQFYEGQVMQGVHDAGTAYMVAGKIERTEEEQLLELLNEKIIWQSSMKEIFYTLYIKAKTNEQTAANIEKNFAQIGISKSATLEDVIKKEIILPTFPFRIYFGDTELSPLQGNEPVYFNCGISTFNIIYSQNHFKFVMDFNGQFNVDSQTKQGIAIARPDNCRNLTITIDQTQIAVTAKTNSGEVTIYNAEHNLNAKF